MRTGTGFMAVALAVSGSALHAQREPSVDSVVAEYLELGVASSWHPSLLFEGCVPLEGWRERAFIRLAAAELSKHQEEGLALAWGSRLGTCKDPRLEQWYFDHLNALVRDGNHALAFWAVLQRADSPRVRAYLEAMMFDSSLADDVRTQAGGVFFHRFGPEELMREYLRAFETMRLPRQLGWAVTERLLREQPERLLSELSGVVRSRPGLGDQIAFITVAQNSHRYATDAARQSLGEALLTGLKNEGGRVTGRHRERLEEAAGQLNRRSR